MIRNDKMGNVTKHFVKKKDPSSNVQLLDAWSTSSAAGVLLPHLNP